jgi:hypothetical protein
MSRAKQRIFDKANDRAVRSSPDDLLVGVFGEIFENTCTIQCGITVNFQFCTKFSSRMKKVGLEGEGRGRPKGCGANRSQRQIGIGR